MVTGSRQDQVLPVSTDLLIFRGLKQESLGDVCGCTVRNSVAGIGEKFPAQEKTGLWDVFSLSIVISIT